MTAIGTAVLCLSATALAQNPENVQRKETMAADVTATATVVSVDQKTREVTLKDKDGRTFSFIAGEKVKNLPQVKPGDIVTATYREGLVYEVKKGGTTGSSSSTTMAGARPGSMPAGVVSERTTVTVKITAIDPKVPSVTFVGPAGNTYTMKVKDPSKLQGVAVGDTVDVTYVEAYAIKVERGPGSK
jgi:Cu/Ag efflux protein CusF